MSVADVTHSSPIKEQSESMTKMDTSTDIPLNNTEGNSVNGAEEEVLDTVTETKTSKRKRSLQKPTETEKVSISNGRPRRTLPKRDELVLMTTVNGTGKGAKTKAQRQSVEQAAGDADDEQERDKNIPILHDVADVVWVKMGGHPWWPSLIIRDPNDTTQCFTKVYGNARAKRMYFVVFYGSTADFAWVSDAAIISYQGVEAFTKYAQEMVDKAQTKHQKEQLTERFQLKVTISRREDWEMAVREADKSVKQSSETRLTEIEPKIQFYTSKLVIPKGQSGRRTKKSETPNAIVESSDVVNRSVLAEKMFDFKSDDDEDDDEEVEDEEESSSDDLPVRKTPSVKIKLKKQKSNDGDSSTTPPAKRRYVRKSTALNEAAAAFGQTINGSSASHQQRRRTSAGESSTKEKKRGRPRISKPLVITNNGNNSKTDYQSASPSMTTKVSAEKKSITKPQAFMNKSHPATPLNNNLAGQHHRFDIRTGFLSPFEEQEVFDAIDQLRSTKTFDEAEQIARRRFEHILCLNLNRTNVDIPQEWFYSFLFAHPIIIVKNPHWFNDKTTTIDNDFLNDVKNSSSSNGITVLKHQLAILSKLYRNELQVRQSDVNIIKQKSNISNEENLHSI